MTKPCVLTDINLAEKLANVPEKLFSTPLTYAMRLTAQNTLKAPSEQRSATAIASDTNQHFPQMKPPLTAQRLGRAMKEPQAFMQTILDWLDEHDEQSEEYQLLAGTRSPDITKHMSPGLAKAALAFMEITAHCRGDQETADILHEINAEINHDPTYKNPFIQAIETPAHLQQQISSQITGWRRQGQALWSQVNQFADQAKHIGHQIAARAKQDWGIVQAATYMPTTSSEAEMSMETKLAMFDKLKIAASRT